MRDWTPERVAAAAGARLVSPPPAGAAGPQRAVVDSRQAGPGDLFVGLRGEHEDGGRSRPRRSLRARGAPSSRPTRPRRRAARRPACCSRPTSRWPRCRGWPGRGARELGARVVAVTGSTGKTSTKDILAALLAPHVATVASPANFNTEIGLPLAILGAPAGTEALVLEMAMRGAEQIAELTAIARPDVGIIVNVGPVHLELMGTLEAVAAAKAELIRDMPAGGTAIVPADEPLLEPHLRDDLDVVTFGDAGDVRLAEADGERVAIDARGERIELELTYTQAYNRLNTLAAVAAALAVGVRPEGRVEVPFSALRGERIDLADGVAVVTTATTPIRCRCARLSTSWPSPPPAAASRCSATCSSWGESGPSTRRSARTRGSEGVDLLVTVGPLAAAMLDAYDGEASRGDAAEAASMVPELLEPGDTVLVKGSRGVGLEAVAEALAEDVA